MVVHKVLAGMKLVNVRKASRTLPGLGSAQSTSVVIAIATSTTVSICLESAISRYNQKAKLHTHYLGSCTASPFSHARSPDALPLPGSIRLI